MRNYNNILAWRKSDDLTVAIYEATHSFPKEEAYSLTSQIRRAAYSVPANIAEGASRNSQKDYLHFLSGLICAVEKESAVLCKSRESGPKAKISSLRTKV